MKKLFSAICMTLVAASMFASSTFAWFSMNTNVTATGMQVTAKTDNAYLIISQGTRLSGSEKMASSSLNVKLQPVKPVGDLSSASVETLSSWGTAISNSPNDANVGADVTPLSSGTLIGDGNYVAKESFMVGIVDGSGAVANDLTLKGLTISSVDDSMIDGITVVVVCGSNLYSHNADFSGGTEKLADKTAVSITGVQVDVYIYIDGSNENVKTSNAQKLKGSVSMEFTIAGSGS